jgi:hypothetical protein
MGREFISKASWRLFKIRYRKSGLEVKTINLVQVQKTGHMKAQR